MTYYAIDVASEAKGEWRVYRRFRQFEKLHDWMRKSEIDTVVKDTLKNMFPGKTWRDATPAEVELRKVRLKEYLIRMFSDPDLKAQAQVQGSVFKNFSLPPGAWRREGGGIRFSQFVRVMRVGVGNRRTTTCGPARAIRTRSGRRSIEADAKCAASPPRSHRDRSRDGTLAGIGQAGR